MNAQDTIRRSSVCLIDRGLHLLRYSSSQSADMAPWASVRPAAGSVSTVQIVTPPGIAPNTLPSPGDCLVIVASAPSKVEITAEAKAGSAVIDAKFNIETLSRGGSDSAMMVQAPAAVQAPVAAPASLPEAASNVMPMADVKLQFIAHVARRGDVVVPAGEWVGGPQAPAPIEGIDIRCEGADVGVAAQFSNSLLKGQWAPWQGPGAFIGTRRRASPLTGLRLRLVGTQSDQFVIEADGAFLGGPVLTKSGAEVELFSASGLDPLVGLRLLVKQIRRVPRDQAASGPPRVRVFRANAAAFGN